MIARRFLHNPVRAQTMMNRQNGLVEVLLRVVRPGPAVRGGAAALALRM